MDRKTAVLLVSRALALVQGICALIETCYLPERLLSYFHYMRQAGPVHDLGGGFYLLSLYRVEVLFLFVRIAIYMTLAFVFWKCAPWVQDALLPERAS
jgi:hypothetical protein